MPALSADQIRSLLSPFILPSVELSDALLHQVSDYLDLLIRWNSRVSLTAIRSPEEIIQRHFGESFFAAGHLATRLPPNAELLDYGSGPGFPGLPIQMLLPNLRVTLAESQAKKAAFLREVIRTLNLNADVWSGRVEDLPESRRFDAVTMRAVEKMASSIEAAAERVRPAGWIAALVGREIDATDAEEFRIPASEHRRLVIWQIVPRGTIT
jgi:16S rRNA (guanine527-N7)-methyltransferase